MNKLRRFLALALIAITAAGCGLSPAYALAPVPPVQPLRDLLTEEKEKTDVKAVLDGIWVGDQEVLRLALGDSMTGLPAQVDMRVRIGGVSETFLGTLLMRLVDAGRVRLEDKVSRWRPDLLAADQVTLVMLIKNTAGYYDYVPNPEFIQRVVSKPFQTVTHADIYKYARATAGASGLGLLVKAPCSAPHRWPSWCGARKEPVRLATTSGRAFW